MCPVMLNQVCISSMLPFIALSQKFVNSPRNATICSEKCMYYYFYFFQVGLSLDETVEKDDLRDLLEVFESPLSLVGTLLLHSVPLIC